MKKRTGLLIGAAATLGLSGLLGGKNVNVEQDVSKTPEPTPHVATDEREAPMLNEDDDLAIEPSMSIEEARLIAQEMEDTINSRFQATEQEVGNDKQHETNLTLVNREKAFQEKAIRSLTEDDSAEIYLASLPQEDQETLTRAVVIETAVNESIRSLLVKANSRENNGRNDSTFLAEMDEKINTGQRLLREYADGERDNFDDITEQEQTLAFIALSESTIDISSDASGQNLPKEYIEDFLEIHAQRLNEYRDLMTNPERSEELEKTLEYGGKTTFEKDRLSFILHEHMPERSQEYENYKQREIDAISLMEI